MLHTFMDCLREDGSREINHHGQTIAVGGGDQKLFQKTNTFHGEDIPTYQDMTQRNEKDLVEARKAFYEQATTFRLDYLELSQFVAKKGIPIVITTFSILYWSYGLFFYFNPEV